VELNGIGQGASHDVLIDAHSGKLVADLENHLSIVPIQVYSAQNQGIKIISDYTEQELQNPLIFSELQNSPNERSLRKKDFLPDLPVNFFKALLTTPTTSVKYRRRHWRTCRILTLPSVKK
jgi:hypothetical protein